MEWRVIPLERHDCHYNMALDQAIEEHVRSGQSGPTIRFYGWEPSAVSIGCFQCMGDEVSLERCEELGIGYVRRRTGGGAVFHDSKGEVTYSVVGPLSIFPQGIRESYREICGWVIRGLANLGIESEFVPINDVVSRGKKISGSAQTRGSGVLLQHGTVLYDLDLERMFSLLKVSREKISDKLLRDARDRVTCVRWLRDVSQAELYRSLLSGFTEGKEFALGSASESETARAGELAQSLYRTKGWNLSR